MKSKSLVKPTTLDYIILGLLQQAPQTGYRIRKAIEETALGNFGGSPGTIYPALRRLKEFGLVENQAVQGKSKSKFSISEKGIGLLRQWLLEPPSKEQVHKHMELLILQFAFMDPLLSKEQKFDFLNHLKQNLENYIAELESYFHNAKDTMPFNGQLAFQHGMLSYKSSLQWCEIAKQSLDRVKVD